MRINTFSSSIKYVCTQIQPYLINPKKIFTFDPPTLSSFKLSSRSLKIIAIASVVIPLTFKLYTLTKGYFRKSNPPPPPPSRAPTEPEAAATESNPSLDYLLTLTDSIRIPPEHRKTLIPVFGNLCGGNNFRTVVSFSCLVSALKVLYKAQEDLRKRETKPPLLSIVDNSLSSGIIDAFNIYSIAHFCFNLLIGGRETGSSVQLLPPPTFQSQSAAEIAIDLQKNIEHYPPFLLVALGLYYFRTADVDALPKAAEYFLLGLLRMKKDFDAYKFPASLKYVESINQDMGSGVEEQIKPPTNKTKRAWKNAKKAAEKHIITLDQKTPHGYDLRWVIFAETCYRLSEQLSKEPSEAPVVIQMEQIVPTALVLQKLYLGAFEREPRFYPAQYH